MVISTVDLLARYHRLRAVQRNLHNVLTKRLPGHAIEEGGKRLGIYRGGVLVFDSEDETSVLMDYCIYDYRWDGLNVIERYVSQHPPKAGSDEKVLLDAMLEARYTLLVIEEIVRGVGVKGRDLIRGDSIFVMDVGMSESGVKGFVIACRIITPGNSEFSMTTGAGLPADSSILARINKEKPVLLGATTGEIARAVSPKPAEFSASVIRTLLEGGASSRIRYTDSVPETTMRAGPGVGRNEPCPCGSGKKYKKCCGKAS